MILMVKYKNEWLLVTGKYQKRPEITLYKFNNKMEATVKGYVYYQETNKMYYATAKNNEKGWFKSPSDAEKWMLDSYGLKNVRKIARSKLVEDYWKNKGKK